MVDTRNKSNLELAEKISAAIANSSLSSKEIALRCGVQPQAVTGWKKTGRISKETLSVFASVVKVPLEHFMPSANGGEYHLKVVETAATGDVRDLVELVNIFGNANGDVRRRILDLARLLTQPAQVRGASSDD